MANIEFSKLGAEILRNNVLTRYIVSRLSKITPEEEKAGFIEIKYRQQGSEQIQVLKLVIAPKQAA